MKKLEYMDKLLEPIINSDKQNFSNRILYNRVYPIANLEIYNDSINHANYEYFNRAWQELYTASFDKDFFDVTTIKEIAYSYERKDTIEIGLINIDFTSIKTDALDSINPKLQIINQKIAKKLNKNPFENKHATILAPLNSETIIGSNITFEFGKIFLNKSSKGIKKLTANFENNQTVNIINNFNLINPIFQVNFQNSGMKEVEFSIIFDDNSALSTYANFKVNTTATRNSNSIITVTASKPFLGYTEPANNCNGACYGQGEYKIYLANGHANIQKPYIIVDGFDPGDKRKIDQYEALEPDDDNIYDMMDYNQNDNLADKLLQKGYDIIILNFPKYKIGTREETFTEYDYYDYENGTQEQEYTEIIDVYVDGGVDYIERNAKVVEALLDEINSQLTANGSNEKIIISGPSMGGLVVRYALAEMEQNAENHNVSLFVSFDAPNQGANIAIGMQKAMQYFDVGLYALKSPAAKQMLINHYLSNSNVSLHGAPEFRDRFQNDLDQIGYPQQCYNIAILNGTLNGTTQESINGTLFYGEIYYIYGSVARKSRIKYTGNSGSNTVFTYKHHRLWGACTVTDITKNWTTLSTYGSIDNSPGGILKLKERIENEYNIDFPVWYSHGITNNWSLYSIAWNSASKWYEKILLVTIAIPLATTFIDYAEIDLRGNFNFVPAKSAIDYLGSNTKWNENIGCRNLVCTGETPFDTYYAPNQNQEHASVHNATANWLINILDLVDNGQSLDNTQVPSNNSCATAGIEISGDDNICSNQTKTYTLTSDCYSGNVSWSTNNLHIISSNNTNITVQSQNQNAERTWIKATFDDNSYKIKYLTGKPSFKIEHIGNNIIELIALGSNFQNQNIIDVIWYQTGGTGTLIANNGQYTAYGTFNGNSGYISGRVKVVNNCGYSFKNFVLIPGIDNDPCDPNNNQKPLYLEKIDINKYRVIDPCDPNQPQYLTNAELYDNYGIKLKDLQTNQDEIIITNENPNQIRIIKATTNTTQKSKIIVTD